MDANGDFMISMFYKTSLGMVWLQKRRKTFPSSRWKPRAFLGSWCFFVSPTQWKNRCKSIWVFSSFQVGRRKRKNTYIWKQHISRILLHGWRSFTSSHFCQHPSIWDVLLSFQADRNDGTPAAPCGRNDSNPIGSMGRLYIYRSMNGWLYWFVCWI